MWKIEFAALQRVNVFGGGSGGGFEKGPQLINDLSALQAPIMAADRSLI
jgi:hypothetical protein